jgi:hypothetical protein
MARCARKGCLTGAILLRSIVPAAQRPTKNGWLVPILSGLFGWRGVE